MSPYIQQIIDEIVDLDNSLQWSGPSEQRVLTHSGTDRVIAMITPTTTGPAGFTTHEAGYRGDLTPTGRFASVSKAEEYSKLKAIEDLMKGSFGRPIQ
jgi:hypothetical protein